MWNERWRLRSAGVKINYYGVTWFNFTTARLQRGKSAATYTFDYNERFLEYYRKSSGEWQRDEKKDDQIIPGDELWKMFPTGSDLPCAVLNIPRRTPRWTGENKQNRPKGMGWLESIVKDGGPKPCWAAGIMVLDQIPDNELRRRRELLGFW